MSGERDGTRTRRFLSIVLLLVVATAGVGLSMTAGAIADGSLEIDLESQEPATETEHTLEMALAEESPHDGNVLAGIGVRYVDTETNLDELDESDVAVWVNGDGVDIDRVKENDDMLEIHVSDGETNLESGDELTVEIDGVENPSSGEHELEALIVSAEESDGLLGGVLDDFVDLVETVLGGSDSEESEVTSASIEYQIETSAEDGDGDDGSDDSGSEGDGGSDADDDGGDDGTDAESGIDERDDGDDTGIDGDGGNDDANDGDDGNDDGGESDDDSGDERSSSDDGDESEPDDAESQDDGNDTETEDGEDGAETKDDEKHPSSTTDETEGEDDRSGASDNDLAEDADENGAGADIGLDGGNDGDADEDDGGSGSLSWLVNAMLGLTTVVWVAGLGVLMWNP